MKQDRAWLYCRTANGILEGRVALEQQEAFLCRYAEDHGYKVVGNTLEVAPGVSLTRPGLVQVMGAAKQKRMDRLLFFNWDRLARSAAVTTACLLTLRHCSVEVKPANGFPYALP